MIFVHRQKKHSPPINHAFHFLFSSLTCHTEVDRPLINVLTLIYVGYGLGGW